MLAEHLRDGRLVAPLPKRYDSARGYFALVASHAVERNDVHAFLRWLIDEAAQESVDAAAIQTPRKTRNKSRADTRQRR